MSENLPEKKEKQNLEGLDTLTERDWKFLTYKMKGYGTAESYRLAGFEGKSAAAPYVLYNHLKKRLLMIQEIQGMDRFHLLMEAKKVLDLPLSEEKTSVTLGEKMKAIRLVSTLIPEAKEPQALNITNFTINRYGTEADKTSAEYKPETVKRSKEVVDAELVDKGDNGPLPNV